MLFHSHVRIGRHLHASLHPTYRGVLPGAAYVFGHVKPDIFRKGAGDRHIYKETREVISELVETLMGGAAPELQDVQGDAVMLGELCHHVSDAFCRFHFDPALYGDLGRHFGYELNLHRYFVRRLDGDGAFALSSGPSWSDFPVISAPPLAAAAFLHWLEQQIARYATYPPSFELDLSYALATCCAVMEQMLPELARRALQRGRSVAAMTALNGDILIWRDAR